MPISTRYASQPIRVSDDGLTVMCEVEHGGIAIEQITLAVPVPSKAEGQTEGQPDGEDAGFEFVLEMIDVEVQILR